MWRGVLGGTLIGGAVGVIVGIVTVVVVLVVHGSLDRVEEQPIYQIGIALGALLGVIIGIGWYIVVVRMALRNRSGFPTGDRPALGFMIRKLNRKPHVGQQIFFFAASVYSAAILRPVTRWNGQPMSGRGQTRPKT